MPCDGEAEFHRGDEDNPAVANVEPWGSIADGEDNNREAYETEEHDDVPKKDDDRAGIDGGADRDNEAEDGLKTDEDNTAPGEPNPAEAPESAFLPFSLHLKKMEKLN